MTTTRDEITINIGNLIGQAANASTDTWDYVAYVFSYEGNGLIGGQPILYRDQNQIKLQTRPIRKELRTNFLRLREITRVDGDDYWIRCLAVVKNDGKKFKMLFEFDDPNRWEITPANARDAYKIVIGDAFPEVLE